MFPETPLEFHYPPLTVMDRCDRCSVQGLVRFRKLSDNGGSRDLVLCGHHSFAWAISLEDEGFTVYENTTDEDYRKTRERK